MENADTAVELFETIAGADEMRLKDLLAETPQLSNACNEQGVSAVMFALYHRQPGLADQLLAAGAEPDAFTLAALGDTEALAALVDSDSSALSAKSADGFSLLHLACFFNHADTALLLIKRGSEVNAAADNPSRVAPINSASACGSTEIVTLLLDNGAHPDAQQHGGYTALMSAAMHGNPEMAETLLAHGASATITAEDGRTAIDMAKEAGHEELARRLDDEQT